MDFNDELSLEFINELLSEGISGVPPPPKEPGIVKVVKLTLPCVSTGCKIQTHYTIDGLAMCPIHAMYYMSKEIATSRGTTFDPNLPWYRYPNLRYEEQRLVAMLPVLAFAQHLPTCVSREGVNPSVAHPFPDDNCDCGFLEVKSQLREIESHVNHC